MSSSRRVMPPFAVYKKTLAATSYSDETDVGGLDVVQYDLVWSSGSSLNYTVTVEFVEEMPTPNSADWVWKTLDFGSTISLSGTAGIHNIVLTQVPFSRCRLKFTKSAGDCALVATIKGKGV